MNQPVRVSLVFPRSGQQVFVHVPRHLAENADLHRCDHSQRLADLPSGSAASPIVRSHDTHAQ